MQTINASNFRLPDHLQRMLPLWYYICEDCVAIISPRKKRGSIKCPICKKLYDRGHARRPNLIWQSTDAMCSHIINVVMPKVRSTDDRLMLQNLMLTQRQRDRKLSQPQ